MAKKRRTGEINVYLGSSSSLEGVLNFSGQARLDGHYRGKVVGTGTLIVGPSAKVEATIEASAVEISGEVIGDVIATERIEMRSPGKLSGNITSPLVVMDEGVQFEGNCRMAPDGLDAEKTAKVRLLSNELNRPA